jgi:hypothetical protein
MSTEKKGTIQMKAIALSIAALFAAAPAFADDAVVVPDDNGTTVIRDHGPLHDNTTIIEHRKPDAVVVPDAEHRDDGYSNGAGAGDEGVGVDVDTHEHVPPPNDDK